jgi:hypothetical protein
MNLTSGLVEERERVSRREGGTGKHSQPAGQKEKGGEGGREEVVRCRVGR